MPEQQSRRLAAIFAADIAGYSALMGADEARTVRDLKAHQEIVLPMIAEHGGRVIDTAGDGILAEFGSVVNAVECAVALQKTMAERNSTVEADRKMQFRIGINLGDIIHDGARVYGDGVNIAARLEGIAEPGGICVSDKVHAEIKGKIDLIYHDLGEQQLKNISRLVRAYRAEPVGLPSAPVPTKQPLALPDKPSIAVLSFTNLSGDKEQEYFSDGITEDIITELSRFSELFVIARNSSFQYKGKSPDIRQVGRDLGVRYVLEGSIRRAGDRVRITAQLIDAATGAHRWPERYDRKLEDVFAVQDEVARTIVAILAAHVNKAEVERTLLKPPATWHAYDYYVRAASLWASYNSSYNVEDLYGARRLLEHSLSIDPNYARAYAKLSNTYTLAWHQSLDADFLNPAALDRADELARKAIRLDPNLPDAHAQLGMVLTWRQQQDAGIGAFEKAFALNPNFTDYRFAIPLVLGGEYERAIEVVRSHMRLDPSYSPMAPAWLGAAYYMLGQQMEALPPLRESVSRAPNFRAGHVWLAAVYAKCGYVVEAHAEAIHVLRIQSNYAIHTQRRLYAFKRVKDAEHLFDGLRMAGLPE